jgi:hypothetical protein
MHTTVVVIPSTTKVVASSTLSIFFGVTYTSSPTSSILLSSTNPAGTQYFPSTQTQNPGFQSTTASLPTGAKVGIAVATIALILFLIILAVLLWRRKVNKGKTPASEAATVTEEGAAESHIFEKDAKTAPVTTVAKIDYSPEPADLEIAGRVEDIYKGSELPTELPLSPSPVYAEVAGPVPSEIDTSRQHIARWASPQPGFVEVDSIPLSHNITSLPSELEDPSYTVYHQASSSPKIPSLPPSQSLPLSSASAQEPTSSTSSTLPIPPYSELHTTNRDTDGEDLELSRMKAEMEALKKEKELVQQLQSIEARERELSRKIAEREPEAWGE